MKNRLMLAKCALLLLAALSFTLSGFAQGNIFTFQGRVNDSSGPVNGPAELRFTLWDVESGGAMPLASNAPPVLALTVSNGLFTVPLNFGAGRFNGADRWVQVELRTTLGPFITITPRQKVTPTPYAITAGNLSGTLPAAQLSGTLPSTLLSGTYSSALTLSHTANQFTGNGAGLTSLNASQLTSGAVPAPALANAWKISGNAGTTPGVNFLGTIDNQPLELKVHGQPAFRIIPATNTVGYGFSPNVIGGFSGNTIETNVIGSVISGGGRGGLAHYIAAHHGTIGGGDRNTVSGENGTVAGGGGNIVRSTYSFVGGGLFNFIDTNINFGACATLGGGYGNTIHRDAYYTTIGGGYFNTVQRNANAATIAGGYQCTIHSNNFGGSIGGGYQNVIDGTAQSAAIGGGAFNTIRSNAQNAVIAGGQANASSAPRGFIGGGWLNQIQPGGDYAVMGGGLLNTIRSNAFNAAIFSGQENTNAAAGAFISGGWRNAIQLESYNSTIAGGDNNTIGGFSRQSALGGGANNTIHFNAGVSVIAGGQFNSIGSNTSLNVIGGGEFNSNSGSGSVIGGGAGNAISAAAIYATIPGGQSNSIGSLGGHSFAAGHRARANHNGSFVWAGGATTNYATQDPNVFNVYAANGASFDYGGQRPDGRGNRWVYIGPLSLGNTIVAHNGARLTDGGAWANGSDKNRKTDVTQIDAREILERLAVLPISQWRYTNENSGVKHLGPMAQDFHAAFGLGTDDKSIGTVDSEGVALAAIQGLNQKVEEQAKQLRAKDTELQSLKQRLDRLEALLTDVNNN
jgi:hypothetical protein